MCVLLVFFLLLLKALSERLVFFLHATYFLNKYIGVFDLFLMPNNITTGCGELAPKFFEGAVYRELRALFIVVILKLRNSCKISSAVLARSRALTTAAFVVQLITPIDVPFTESAFDDPSPAALLHVITDGLAVLQGVTQGARHHSVIITCLVMSQYILKGPFKLARLVFIWASRLHLLQNFPFLFVARHVLNAHFALAQGARELFALVRMHIDTRLAVDVPFAIFKPVLRHSVADTTDELRLELLLEREVNAIRKSLHISDEVFIGDHHL